MSTFSDLYSSALSVLETQVLPTNSPPSTRTFAQCHSSPPRSGDNATLRQCVFAHLASAILHFCHRATGPPGRWATGPPDYRATGLPGHRTTALLRNRATALPSYGATKLPSYRYRASALPSLCGYFPVLLLLRVFAPAYYVLLSLCTYSATRCCIHASKRSCTPKILRLCTLVLFVQLHLPMIRITPLHAYLRICNYVSPGFQ